NLAVPGAEAPKPPRKFDPLTPELRDLIGRTWQAAPADEALTRLALRADFGTARARVHADVGDLAASRPLLLERLTVLEELGEDTCVPVVLPHLASDDAAVQRRALAVLGRVGGPGVAEAVLKAYPALPGALKVRAREVLFGRAEGAKAFLALVD